MVARRYDGLSILEIKILIKKYWLRSILIATKKNDEDMVFFFIIYQKYSIFLLLILLSLKRNIKSINANWC
jgi:hypothetical protein